MEKETTFNLYQIVTNKIITLLQQGIIPWRKPWSSGGPPMNAMTKRPYSGINLWLLLSLNYESNLFLTFDQVKKLGGSVNKGERGHLVVFWAMLKPVGKEEEQESERIPYLRYYTLFNVAQCNHLPPSAQEPCWQRQLHPVKACENIVRDMPQRPEIRFEKAKAFYHPQEDYVNLPSMNRFDDEEAYYATLFHELVHSTGHPNRLNRKSLTEITKFGSAVYSFEELIAELGSCYLCSYANIGQKELSNSAAYLHAWIQHLQEDPKCILSASSQAQKAVEFILKKEPEVSLLGQPDTQRA